MGLVLIFDYVLRQARSRIMQTVALRVDVVMGRLLFNKMMALPLHTLESRPSSHWTSLYRDVDTVRNTLSGASALLIADLPFVLLFLGVIVAIASAVAWVLLLVLPVFLFVAYRSGAVMADANQKERRTGMTRDAMITEMINGRATIKALALDQAMRPIWEDRHADNIENAIVRGSKADGYSNLGSTLTLMTTVSLTSVGAIAIIDQAMTMGALIATNMLSGRILGPLNQLVGTWRTYSNFLQAVDRLDEIFESESERLESEVQLDKPRGNIEVENATFAYAEEDAAVVDNVQLTIEEGGVHALVGRNGSGKSTLLKLIQGLYRPQDGRVLLDGADIAQFTRSELADWMGYVPQDCILFEGSVRDNIAHRHPDSSDDDVIAASTAAGVHHFIIDLPDGYATDIGEAGRRLSGGQRQRIAIARALLGDPPVLLMDEPSSSLDRQAEQELRNTMVEFGKKRTVIVVTHSPILLAACDHLVALDRGRIALAGPAKEILPKLLGRGARGAAADEAKDDSAAKSDAPGATSPPTAPPRTPPKPQPDAAPAPEPAKAAPAQSADAGPDAAPPRARSNRPPPAVAKADGEDNAHDEAAGPVDNEPRLTAPKTRSNRPAAGNGQERQRQSAGAAPPAKTAAPAQPSTPQEADSAVERPRAAGAKKPRPSSPPRPRTGGGGAAPIPRAAQRTGAPPPAGGRPRPAGAGRRQRTGPAEKEPVLDGDQ